MTKPIQSGKDLAQVATDLTDEEITKTVQIVNVIRQRYAGRTNTVDNLEELRDEVLTKLAEINILATFDPAPCFYGEPPELEIIGKINTDPIHKQGFDHELKSFQVNEALKRGEDYLGQKERINKRRPKDGPAKAG